MDFGNGTYQGAANGLAILWKNNLLPKGFCPDVTIQRIKGIFHGTKALTRKDGSLEEAFPFEGSFCVTALVAYDLLSAMELLGNKLQGDTRSEYISIIEPMIRFLHRADETHGLISNHLATAVAGLVKWQSLTGEDVSRRTGQILSRITDNQSPEGWFSEYGGCDPGYQSLCTYYLAEAHRVNPELGLLEPLRKSIQFLWYFAHPDGSFGGYYGSRNTRCYYPGGIESLSPEIPEAASLAAFMRESIQNQKVVTLASIDEPNLIPTFTSYCLAASKPRVESEKPLPVKQKPFQESFKQAGLFIDHGQDHHTIVSTSKGGVVYHYVEGRLKVCNPGLASQSAKKSYSTQAYDPTNPVGIKDGEITVECKFTPVLRRLPTPFQFIILRILNLTIMRNYGARDMVKQFLVKFLITGKMKHLGINRRVIKLGKDLQIGDTPTLPPGMNALHQTKPFSAIHMASQGYWQIQDEEVLA